jgi:hypothetical protein
MKYHDNGCFHSVSISAAEIKAFKDRWPCSGLPSRGFWFQFDKRNGDLVDMKPSEYDGEALLALSQDAQQYADKKAKAAKPAKTII